MLVDLDIKNSNISLPIMLGASPFFFGWKISKRQHPFYKGIFCPKYFVFVLEPYFSHHEVMTTLGVIYSQFWASKFFMFT
jgi:hypothetical protein